jgi:hypothetical protein
MRAHVDGAARKTMWTEFLTDVPCPVISGQAQTHWRASSYFWSGGHSVGIQDLELSCIGAGFLLEFT